jgi:uncharacterized protein (DUF1499 family)
MTPHLRKSMLYVLYAAIGLIVVAVAAGGIALLAHVEDWSRDLTTNVAATDAAGQDERLRPIRSDLSPVELGERATAAARTLPRWELAGREQIDGTVQIHFVRTTGVMRYKDDIRVSIKPADSGSLLSAESRSRVGRGDLGQNPRNLRELLGAIRRGL